MFGTYIRKTWLSDPTLYAPARFRRACAYDAFIPDRLTGLSLRLSGTTAGVISEAEAAIRTLNEGAHPALDAFQRLLLRTESIASSKVEGLQVDVRSLARAEARKDAGQQVTPTALEVLANVDAMQTAIETATAEPRVEPAQIVAIHAALMRHSDKPHIAGQIRDKQNWIGGNDHNPCDADYVPPPPEEVPALLADLCEFCNDDSLSPLVQAALAHAQFETIHPHEDGNGRTGRALVQVILRRRGLSPNFVPPISVVLATDKQRYIDGLTAFREGDFERWFHIFAVAAARAARLARRYLTEIEHLQERWRAQLAASAQIRQDAAAWRLINELPGSPVVTLPVAVALVRRSKPAVNRAIAQLADAGVLEPVSESRRYRAWEAHGLLALLARLEAGDLPDDEPEEERRSSPDRRIPDEGEQSATALSGADMLAQRLGPGSWLVPPADPPDVTLRVAVAVPDVLPMMGWGDGGPVTLLRGQRREALIVDRLVSSPVTVWLHSLAETWGWDGTPEWVPVGTGSPELTELWFAPFGLDNRRPAFLARCGIVTGTVDGGDATSVSTIQAALDVMFNVVELDGRHRPGPVAHRTDDPPAPAALGLEEIADALHQLLDFPDVVVGIGRELLPAPRLTTVKVGEWITFSGHAPDRLIDLRRFSQLPRSSGLGQLHAGALLQPYRAGAPWPTSWGFVADLLYEGLERGGYRDVDETIEAIRYRAQ